MAIVVEFSVPAEAFSIGRLFSPDSKATVELERVVPTKDVVCPYLWIMGCSREMVESVVVESGEPVTLTIVDEPEPRKLLVRAEWPASGEGLLRAFVEAPVTVLSGRCTAAGWRFSIRADDHAGVEAFQRECRANGAVISVERVQPLGALGTNAPGTLTGPQLEALELAYRRGYYEDSRTVTLDSLAEEPVRELG